MMSSRKKLLFTIFLFSSGLSLLAFFAIKPLVVNIRKNAESLTWQRSILKLLDDQIANVASFKQNYQIFQPILEKLNQGFISQEAPIRFIQFLEKEAQKNNIIVNVLPLSSLKKESDFLSLDFEILTAGSFLGCARFLAALELSPWFFEISDFRIERIGRKSRWQNQFEELKEGDVISSISLKAFTKKNNE